MAKFKFLSFWIINLFVCATVRQTLAVTFEECDGIPNETYIAVPDSCEEFIQCLGDDSWRGACDDNEYFNGDEGVCDDKENVYCPFDNEVESEEENTGNTNNNSTNNNNNNGNSNGDNEEQTNTSPVTPTPNPGISCPETDDPTKVLFKPSSESCSKYYICYHGQPFEMQCTDHLYFNATAGRCDFPENVQCTLDPAKTPQCSPFTTDFFPHPSKCNLFYYCIKGFLSMQQCPFNYGWDTDQRTCVHISQARCFNAIPIQG